MNNFLARLAHHAQQDPQKIALVGENISLTYGELFHQVNELSEWLQTQKIARAGLWGENSIAWVIADLAALKAQITLVPLPRFFSATQLQHVIAEAQLPCLLVCGDIEKIVAVNKCVATPIKNIFCDYLSVPGKNTSLDAIRKITFTSGTTGTPKGVCLNQDALENVIQALAQRIYSTPGAAVEIIRHFTVLPLSTLLENIAGIYVPLYLGKQIVVLPGAAIGLTGSSQLSLPTLLRSLQQYQPNSLIMLPQILQGCVAASAQRFPLILSLLLALTYKLQLHYRWSIIALACGLLGSVLLAHYASDLAEAFDGRGQELFNAVLYLVVIISVLWVGLLMVSIFFSQHHKKNSADQSIAMLKKAPNSLIILCSVIVSCSLAREASEIWIYFSSFEFQTQAFYSALIGAAIGVGIGMSLGGIIYYLLVFMREKYFIPGFLVVVTLLAGGLSMQVAKQLMQIGLLDSNGPLWDSSFLINEQSWMGELLYALFGYDAQPTSTQGFFYLAATLPMVIGFLWHWRSTRVNNHVQKK